MIVISDTSPINYLMLTGDIDILEKLFRRIVVPQAVFSELQHAKTPQRVKVCIANAEMSVIKKYRLINCVEL